MADFLNFDANASYGLLPEVKEELCALLPEFASGRTLNPSSIHGGGQRAKLILDDARDAVRELIGASPGCDVVFTSGATEGNNWLLSAPFLEGRTVPDGAAVVTTAIEHHSVLEPVERLKRRGVPTAYLSPGSNGRWESSDVKSVSPGTLVFSCMAANNETGEILPVAHLSRRVRSIAQEAFVHCDAVQAAGKIPLAFDDLRVDAVTLSAHKLGGLTGVGAVVFTKDRTAASFILGGPQESRHRAGTENVLGIASLGIAARIAKRDLPARIAKMQANSETARALLLSQIPGSAVVREEVPRLPNTILLNIPGVRADDLVVACDLRGIGISSGAACASGKQLPSHVLLALGYPIEFAKACVRISFRAEESEAAITAGTEKIIAAALQLRRADGVRADPS